MTAPIPPAPADWQRWQAERAALLRLASRLRMELRRLTEHNRALCAEVVELRAAARPPWTAGQGEGDDNGHALAAIRD